MHLILQDEGETVRALCHCSHLCAAKMQALDCLGPRNNLDSQAEIRITCALLSSVPLVVTAPRLSKFA